MTSKVYAWFIPATVVAWTPATATAVQRDTFLLEELVVTVTRLPTLRDAVASAVAVIDGAELRLDGTYQAFDALRDVPGASVVQGGSFGGTASLFLRGGESDYVQVLVDGISMNSPGGAFNFANLTTDNLERIEVLRGPSSVLYGSDAVSGVVQLFTSRGSGRPSIGLGTRAGTFGTVHWDASLRGGSDRASYSFSLSRFSSDGIYDFNNQYHNLSGTGFIEFEPDDRTTASLSLRYGENTYHFPTDGSGNLVDRNQFTFEDATSVGVNISRFLTEHVEAQLHLSAHEADRGFDDRPDGAADTLGFFGFSSLGHVRTRTADVRANAYLGPKIVVTAGAQIEQQSERSVDESLSEFGTSSTSLDLERVNDAAYVQLIAQPTTGLALNVGGRLDDNDSFGTFATYRTGAAYRWRDTRVRATAGTGFKEPTFFENFASGFVTGNPSLEPERSFSWEVGIEQRIAGGALQIGTTYFDQRFRDLIQFTFSPPSPGQPNYFNVAGANASGVEVDATITPARGLALSGRYTYLRTTVTDPGFDTGPDATFVDGERLLRRPTHGGSVRAAFRWARGALTAGVQFVGSRADRDFSAFPAVRVSLPGYGVLTGSAQYTVMTGGGGAPEVVLTLRAENALDEDYTEVVGFPGRGRTLLFGTRVRW